MGLNNLADAYETGRGLDRDDVKAAELYRQAAELGLASAQKSLGNMYAEGRGVPKDDEQARLWWRLAAEQGNTEALENLATLEK
ncbi:MAG: sel1 repeat family protein [Gammaproteobacteria bacterium]|nr:sel1 repeat family protein [Gammaproteobacteria bacterium]